MDKESHKKQLFQKFINNECTDAELEEILVYINASEIPAEFEVLMQENLEQKMAEQAKVSPEVSSRLFRNIQANIDHDQAGARIRALGSISIRKFMAVAAIISLILLAGFAYFYTPVFHNTEQIYATTYGETREILLPDGSKVVLNANSKLKFTSDWEVALQQNEDFVREVWLEGEGIFEVERLTNPTRFIVHTAGLEVEVLGTTFNVNARNQKTRVVLDEGKVKVKAKNQIELVMQPGELVELAENDDQFQKKEVNPDHYMSWRHNELFFEATPLTEVAEILEDNYGFEVTVRGKAVTADMLFTGKVPADNTELLLKMLSESFNIRIIQEDKKLIFQQ